IGVEPSFLMAWGTPSPVLDELITVEDMNERKKKMMELADHFIACPGGIGTLDEITDIIVQKELGQLFGKAILFNVNGFYEPLRALLAEMQQHGFIRSTLQNNVFYANSVEEIAALLEE
ncbi:MAG: LOG family protein, partial [Solobacterium sp.]|nr:LOG family protein [Solobacterium sp.]